MYICADGKSRGTLLTKTRLLELVKEEVAGYPEVLIEAFDDGR
jgi:hypothetical protein